MRKKRYLSISKKRLINRLKYKRKISTFYVIQTCKRGEREINPKTSLTSRKGLRQAG